MKLPVDRFLNFVYSWCLDRMPDTEQREEWLMQLESPLPGQAHRAPTEEQLEKEFAGWGGLLAAQGRA